MAIPGHIRAIESFRSACPGSAVGSGEQANRQELLRVIRDAAWAVFQENYQGGYGQTETI